MMKLICIFLLLLITTNIVTATDDPSYDGNTASESSVDSSVDLDAIQEISTDDVVGSEVNTVGTAVIDGIEATTTSGLDN